MTFHRNLLPDNLRSTDYETTSIWHLGIIHARALVLPDAPRFGWGFDPTDRDGIYGSREQREQCRSMGVSYQGQIRPYARKRRMQRGGGGKLICRNQVGRYLV